VEAAGSVGWFAGRPLASWGRRAAALGLDGVIFTVAMVALTAVGLAVNRIGNGALMLPEGLTVTLAVLLVVLPVLVLVWNQGIEQGRTGQSWGKRLLGLRVVRVTTLRPLGPAAGFARFVLHQVVDAGLWYIGFLWPLWDERRQTLADKLVGSVVLDERGDRPDRARSSAGAQVLILAAAIALTVAFVALFFSYVSSGP
jgi:serine/threonine-protein kinase